MSEQAIHYEQLVTSYEDRLLNQLRGHGVDLDFLEMWVPDEDTISSILNMVEAAGAFGVEAFSIRIKNSSLPTDQRGGLKKALSPVSNITLEEHEDCCFVHISNIKA
jgi:hypothetical protein|eukprot:NODE_13172_length_437_cov_1.190323_g13149_i0.p1 GENE.NODE_13172_length_437_cov_1.190323_g13149_i0~~NODE_13172_length_437_cov_1.190323_g13149_i0.p1  ORF type:complete len:107 (+),score=10.41 NODE_13172_length_437_cov_1.190323_g13149_i0:109-429(+)